MAVSVGWWFVACEQPHVGTSEKEYMISFRPVSWGHSR